MTKVLQPWINCRAVQDFRRSFDDAFRRSPGGSRWSTRTATLSPSMELTIEGDEYVLRLDLPRVDPESIEVTVNEDILTLRGFHRRRDPQASWDVIYCELARGCFERRVRLPAGFHSEDIRAIYHDGMLELRMSSPQKVRARKVPIRVEAVKGRIRSRTRPAH